MGFGNKWYIIKILIYSILFVYIIFGLIIFNRFSENILNNEN
jgi:hypothetical protein